MERLKYFDFDLLIERSQDRYRARVLQSPGGQASADFVLPFTDEAVENLMLRVGRVRRGVRRLESPEMQAAKLFGGKLFDAVFVGDVRGAFRSSIETANREGAGLRIRLRLTDTPELVDLPWEFLYNPALNRFIALSNKTPLVRYIELPESPRPLKIEPPLRVLVMISSPSDYETLDVEREWQKLNEALRDLITNNMVTLERLDSATLRSLRRKLRQGQYHVLHFVGHGGFDAQIQDGVLLLEDEQGRGRRTSGQYLATVLTDHDYLRLVVLNACEGARTARNDPFAGVAQSLVQQGISAVIAMQFEVTDEASIVFAQEFYSGLADGYPVDAALGEARGAIFSEVNDLEWGTPVLYLRAPDGMIFAPLSPQERAELERRRLAEAQRAREEQARLDEERRVSDEQVQVANAQRERQHQIETLIRDADASFAKDDFDATEESLAALLALDAGNVNALALQTKIQDAKQARAHEQARLAQEQRVREQQEQLIEHLIVDAQTYFANNNLDAAESSLAELLVLDPSNANARELKMKIQAAREQRAAEQEQLGREQRAREQRERERQQQIDELYLAAQSSFEKNDFDAADRSLSALLLIDPSNETANQLQAKIQGARQRVAKEHSAQALPNPTPSDLPERAQTGTKLLAPVPAPRPQGFPIRYAVLVAGVIISALLLCGAGANALGLFRVRTPTPTSIAGLNSNADVATDTPTDRGNSRSGTELPSPTLTGRGTPRPVIEPSTSTPEAVPVAVTAAPTSAVKVLRLGTTGFPDSLDPQKVSFANEFAAVGLAYEGLLGTDKNGNVGPGAADEWELSADKKKMTFHIRDGLVRSDGARIGCADFEYALKREVDPFTPGKPYTGIVYDIKGARELDAYANETEPDKLDKAKVDELYANYGVNCLNAQTLEIEFDNPLGFWEYVASAWVTYPTDKRALDSDPDSWWARPEGHVGNGMFMIKEIDKGKKIVFGANPNYWRGRPTLDRIEINYYPDQAAVLDAYQDGQVDLITLTSGDLLETVNGNPTLQSEFVRYPAAWISTFMFNHQRAPFSDKNVRTAFAKAFDQEKFIQQVQKGVGRPYSRWIPPGIPGAVPSRAGVPSYDPKGALVTLVENGYAAADSTAEKPKVDCDKLGEIKLTYPESTSNHARYGFLAQNFASVLACPIVLDPVDPTLYTSLTRDPKTAPLIQRAGWIQDYPYPQNWLSVYWECGSFSARIGYCDEGLDSQLRAADAEVDFETALSLYQAAEDYLLADVPFAVIGYIENLALVKPYVLGPASAKSTSDVAWLGEHGPVWEYDIDLNRVPSSYPKE